MTVVYEELTTEFAYRLTLQSLKVKSVMLYQFFCVQWTIPKAHVRTQRTPAWMLEARMFPIYFMTHNSRRPLNEITEASLIRYMLLEQQ